MEENKNALGEHETAEDIVTKARKNAKTIMWCLIVAAVVVVGVLAWIFVAQNGSRKADELIAKADAATTDSVAIELYQKAADAGYKSGNRAKAELGILYYQKGDYEKALTYLNDCSLNDDIAEAGVETLRGDCYVNLEKYAEALDCYDDAIDAADENPQIVPFVLIKMAHIYRQQGEYAKEAKAYKTILDDYPTYVNGTRVDIRRYYERAKAQAGE